MYVGRGRVLKFVGLVFLMNKLKRRPTNTSQNGVVENCSSFWFATLGIFSSVKKMVGKWRQVRGLLYFL